MSCAICKEDEFSQPVSLECGHTFCGLCIVSWFRQAGERTCPLCRDPGESALDDTITATDAYERARVLLHMSRRKAASKQLKSAVARYRRMKEKAAAARRNMREFCADNRELLKQHTRLRQQKWTCRRNEKRALRRIGFSVFSDDDPVPVVTATPWFFSSGT